MIWLSGNDGGDIDDFDSDKEDDWWRWINVRKSVTLSAFSFARQIYEKILKSFLAELSFAIRYAVQVEMLFPIDTHYILLCIEIEIDGMKAYHIIYNKFVVQYIYGIILHRAICTA